MEDLANFVGMLLLVMSSTVFIALPLSFSHKYKSLRVASVIAGFPGAAIGAILLFNSASGINMNTILIASAPLISYGLIVFNVIRLRARV